MKQSAHSHTARPKSTLSLHQSSVCTQLHFPPLSLAPPPFSMCFVLNLALAGGREGRKEEGRKKGLNYSRSRVFFLFSQPENTSTEVHSNWINLGSLLTPGGRGEGSHCGQGHGVTRSSLSQTSLIWGRREGKTRKIPPKPHHWLTTDKKF